MGEISFPECFVFVSHSVHLWSYSLQYILHSSLSGSASCSGVLCCPFPLLWCVVMYGEQGFAFIDLLEAETFVCFFSFLMFNFTAHILYFRLLCHFGFLLRVFPGYMLSQTAIRGMLLVEPLTLVDSWYRIIFFLLPSSFVALFITTGIVGLCCGMCLVLLL
uniref:Hypothetical transmembrane protein n=1 Tax=Trypanosoma brucei TaxID=5691 RepID=Q8WPT7_9TRYP|nr:hypothetical transmembrane protein [Trypanosoma brucei]